MKKGFTLVEIMLVVAIMVVIVTIALPNLLRARMNTNEVLAQKSLQAIAAAYEMYFSTNGVYPPDDRELVGARPPYLNRSYCKQIVNGYRYLCENFSHSPRVEVGKGYVISAAPNKCNIDGTHNYVITTGMQMKLASECSSETTPATPTRFRD